MEATQDITNQLIELSVQMNTRGAHVAALATEKLAMKVARNQVVPQNLLAIMGMIEVTETAMKTAQAQVRREQNADIKQALIHKEATLRAMLNRINESIENC